ncbi:alpha/beta fold hydrolase [uncultured Microbacterium sp.]|uniref:alpha/beta fold hydrolase n=1 Tax=uncultured Microbacterium sp. TaxID=191216 RepID=UPI00261CE69F|nr:alpha/beta fold hydrolase [uncultured Microbacterium sp.]
MIEYHLPGIFVREQTLPAPLDWNDPEGEQIEVFVRELVDPDRRTQDLPLLTFLQGGPGGANPRPTGRSGWIDEALKDYRIVLVDQRGTGRSTPLEATMIAERGERGGEFLVCFRADSIVRDLELVRREVYGSRRWATLGQSYGGWLTMAYLSYAPEAITASYVCGGIPGIPADVDEVYRRTFTRTEQKNAEYRRRFPHDVDTVAAIADVLAGSDVHLADGDRLTVERFQSLGSDFGMKPGFERMHWLIDEAFIRPGRLSEAFLAGVQARTSSAGGPLYWSLQESIYADGTRGATAWSAQRERDRRPQFGVAERPLLFTGEMSFPWMFEQVRLLRPAASAVHALHERGEWPALYDLDRLAANEVPLAAAVYFDDMYVDSGLQLDTLSKVGNAQNWVTNEFEHDGIATPEVFRRLRAMVRDHGGELPDR